MTDEAVKVDPRLQRMRKRFTRRQWLRRWTKWRALIVAVLLLIVVAALVWLVEFSSVLTATKANVEGLDASSDAPPPPSTSAIASAAKSEFGTPLVRADLGKVRDRILAIDAVESVEVSRSWPHTIAIRVVLRTPVAAVEIGGQFHALDADGVVFGDYPKAPTTLPLVETSADAQASVLKQAALIATSLPSDLAKSVDHINVATIDEISLSLSGGRTVIWGSSTDSATKADVLTALMKAEPHAQTYDVSVPGQPLTKN